MHAAKYTIYTLISLRNQSFYAYIHCCYLYSWVCQHTCTVVVMKYKEKEKEKEKFTCTFQLTSSKKHDLKTYVYYVAILSIFLSIVCDTAKISLAAVITIAVCSACDVLLIVNCLDDLVENSYVERMYKCFALCWVRWTKKKTIESTVDSPKKPQTCQLWSMHTIKSTQLADSA